MSAEPRLSSRELVRERERRVPSQQVPSSGNPQRPYGLPRPRKHRLLSGALTTLMRDHELGGCGCIDSIGKMCGQDENSIHADIVTRVADDVNLRSWDVGHRRRAIYMVVSPVLETSEGLVIYTWIPEDHHGADPFSNILRQQLRGIVDKLPALRVTRCNELRVGAECVSLLDLLCPVGSQYEIRKQGNRALDVD